MTRKEDFTMPWGREQPDSIVALTLAEKNYHAHRACVMSQVTTIDTSNPNDNNPITDLFNSGKRPMLRRLMSCLSINNLTPEFVHIKCACTGIGSGS